MNFSFKNATLAALCVGGLAAGGAAQALDLPTSGNGSLVLFVTNTSTNQVYVRDLGLHMDDLITQGTGAGQTGDTSLGAVNTVNLSIGTIGPDAALTNFLTTGSTSEFTWNVIGGDGLGGTGATAASASRRFALTSTADLATATPPSNSALGTISNSETSLLTQVIGTLAGANSVVAAAGAGSGQINIALVNTHFNQSPQTTTGALDSSLNFFLLSSSSSSNPAAARVFVLNDLQLSAEGVLSSVPGVPLPAAVWLFGSGLLGLAGIGRRRKQANSPLAA